MAVNCTGNYDALRGDKRWNVDESREDSNKITHYASNYHYASDRFFSSSLEDGGRIELVLPEH